MKLKNTLTLFLALLLCSASPAVFAEEISAKDVITQVDLPAIAESLNTDVAALEKAAAQNPEWFLKAAYAGDLTAIAMLLEAEQASAAEAPFATILYTNDVHNAYTRSDEDGQMGYAAVAAYKAELEAAGHTVTLVDCGDSIQGGAIGTLSKGSYIAEIMDEVGYSFAIPGNHEFDFGMDNFLEIAETYDYEYLCCNFVDLQTGEPVFDAYEIVSYGETDVAFIGVATPESFTKSTPMYFQNADGEYIYSFCEGGDGAELYAAVQNAADDAAADGADYVVLLAHLGTDAVSEPWRSYDVIANTTGIDAVLDGHSHSVIEQELVENKAGEPVLLSSAGTKLANLGVLTIDENGVKTSLVSGITADDAAVAAYIAGITAQFEELLNTVVAESEVALTTQNPETGERIVRSMETNLGDLCADAYRTMLGADVAFVNGGGIRANIDAGEITYEEIIAVHPYGNEACLIEATGRQIADALEFGARAVGIGESGGFLQVSGLTYAIDTNIPSSVVTDDKEMFVEVAGERRVFDIRIGGEPIDWNKTYTLASHNYMLKNAGDGYSMFAGCKILKDCVMIDNQVLIDYIVEVLDGIISADSIYADYRGNDRIMIIQPEIPETPEDAVPDIPEGTKIASAEIEEPASEEETNLPAPNIRYFTYLANSRH